MTGLMERLDDLPRPAWIALVVLLIVLVWQAMQTVAKPPTLDPGGGTG